MARFTTLYSGSSGNCGVIMGSEGFLLVDMGKSCRTTLTGLKELGLSLSDLKGILITHEHVDHVAGLKVFLKKYPVPVYGRADTLENLKDQVILPEEANVTYMEGQCEPVGEFFVTAFATSHDVPCCGYRVRSADGKVMAIATDLGVLTPSVHEALAGCDFVALESNYDLGMLRSGPYPYYLKKRIESNRGHLSNDECAAKILELVQEGCNKFALCHMSKENNTMERVLVCVRNTLVMAGVRPAEGSIIQVQLRNEVSPVIEY